MIREFLVAWAVITVAGLGLVFGGYYVGYNDGEHNGYVHALKEFRR